MKRRIKIVLTSIIITCLLTTVSFATSNKENTKNKEEIKVEDTKRQDKNNKKEENKKEENKKENSNKNNDKVKEKPEDLVYNIVVSKNGSITTDYISEATYNGIMEILEEESKSGKTYKTIDQNNTIILHESYGYKLTNDVQNKIMSKYSTKLPNIEKLIKNNNVNREEKIQRNKKLLFMGVILWLSLNGVPRTSEVIRKKR